MQTANSRSKTTYLLLILDGWGHREEKTDNAIAQANTPNWDRMINNYPSTQLSGSGLDVGLPDGQMGNSEVGHMNIGAGRIVYQDLTRINRSIEQFGLGDNPALVDALSVTDEKKTVHLMGLLSEGGVHSHQKHLFAIINLFVKQQPNPATSPPLSLHLFLDGRDTPPQSARTSLAALQARIGKLQAAGYNAQITSLCGRFYSMDRDQRWERIQLAYEAITQGKARHYAKDPIAALEAAYARGETDEFVAPTLIQTTDAPPTGWVQAGDSLIFFNFRADRARQISQALSAEQFSKFDRGQTPPQLSQFLTMTQYSEEIASQCIFEPFNLAHTLPDCLAEQGMQQLRMAETEKYAHVTFFLNGGKEAPVTGEERVLIPSPPVKTYDLAPEMSLPALSTALCTAIRNQTHDLIVCNIANGDMVGHTGNFPAGIKAAEAIDLALGEIERAIKDTQSQCLITADHGNLEQMVDPDTKAPHTAHTSNPVPLVYIGPQGRGLQPGILADLAPTLLTLMGLPIPKEMTGRPLIID